MEERTHLELRQLAERCRARLEGVEETLRRAAQDDGPTILAAIREAEEILGEFSELFEPEITARRNAQLAQIRQRFQPDTLSPNQRLSRRGYVSLRQAVQHAARANEALVRCISGIRDNLTWETIQREFHDAYNQIAETVHYSYLITLADH